MGSVGMERERRLSLRWQPSIAIAGRPISGSPTGMDVVQAIEKVKTDRFDKPLKDVKIINIEISAT